MSDVLVKEFMRNGKKGEMVTCNNEMKEIVNLALNISNSNLPILLLGETGTGKDVLAKVIHFNSNRKDRPFIEVSPAIPETLVESLLFGSKKGSYTGALYESKGLVEEAVGGTLYLSEISEIKPDIQVKLLKVVEEKKFRKVGETKESEADFRIVASSNGNLSEMLGSGKLRKDLYYRLSGIELKLLPLRERLEDIPILVDHFLKEYHTSSLLTLDPKIMKIFLDYDWEGNVRELENKVRDLISFLPKEENQISLSLLEKIRFPEVWEDVKPKLFLEKLAEFEKEEILKALIATDWIQTKAAEILGINESRLRFLRKKLKIKRPS